MTVPCRLSARLSVPCAPLRAPVSRVRNRHWGQSLGNQARWKLMTPKQLDITATLETGSGTASYVSFAKLAAVTGADVARLPHTVKILLENIARRAGGRDVSEADVVALSRWPNDS